MLQVIQGVCPKDTSFLLKQPPIIPPKTRLPIIEEGEIKSRLSFYEKLLRQQFNQWFSTMVKTSRYGFAVRVKERFASEKYPEDALLLIEPKCELHSGNDVLVQSQTTGEFYIITYLSPTLWVKTYDMVGKIDYHNAIVLGKIIGMAFQAGN